MSQLPVGEVIPTLVEKLSNAKRLILAAPPGAGKSTAVPLALMEQKFLQKKILMLEPRRLAAVSVCHYMAAQRNEVVGQSIGYRIRHEAKVSATTRLEIVTEGLLLRKLLDDPLLEDYSLVIFDEFHERNREADLALTFLTEVQNLRDDLKLLVMSATLDTQKISQYLQAEVIACQGRQYEVEISYADSLGISGTNYLTFDNRFSEQFYSDLYKTLRVALKQSQGNVLVFLPGVREISRVIENFSTEQADIVALHGSLDKQQQFEAIRYQASRRKIILATNVAETSITIEGISAVVDSGFARFLRYDPSSQLETLTLDYIAQDSATQRSGRAGRQSHGKAYRMWLKAQERAMPLFSAPAILQADALSSVLTMLALGLDPLQSNLPDPISNATTMASLEVLSKLQLYDKNKEKLTQGGIQVAKLPLHPRLSAMLWRYPSFDIALAAVFLQEYQANIKSDELDIVVKIAEVKNNRVPNHQRDFLRRMDLSLKQIQNILPLHKKNEKHDFAQALAFAFFDRIAKRRDQQTGVFQISNGITATIESRHFLAQADYLIVLGLVSNLGRQKNHAKISLAIEYDLDSLLRDFSNQITETIVREEDDKNLRFYRQKKYDSLVLEQKQMDSSKMSAEHWQKYFIELFQNGELTLSEGDESWRRRAEILFGLGLLNIDCSLEFLRQHSDTWLKAFLLEAKNIIHAQESLHLAFDSLLDYQTKKNIEELLPATVTLPTTTKVAIDYSGDFAVLAVKLQEVFGMPKIVSLANGQWPLKIHLLSPAKRPVQITDDLSSFWRNTYPQVRKELRGRYPKHSWPEDPLTAAPTKK